MRIIGSPAKQMVENVDDLDPEGLPVFVQRAEEVASYLKGLTYAQLKGLWACNDKLAEQNYERLRHLDLYRNLTPAILAYDGIAFKYMAPRVFENDQFSYVQDHLRILSGFYGVLRALDGVTPYRLEMQAKAAVAGTCDLYAYWGAALYGEVQRDNADRVVVNLASKEYSKCVEKYLQPGDTFANCVFGELEGEKVVQKGVYAKMARGEMVRYMAEINATNPEDLKGFNRLGYAYSSELSNKENLVFIKCDKK